MLNVHTSLIPDREPTQDEAIVLLVIRRSDVAGEFGDPTPDIGSTFSAPNEPFVAAVADFIDASGFDRTQSFLTVVGVTDVETGGAISIYDLQNLIAENSEPDEEE